VSTERLVVVEGSGEEVSADDRVMVAFAYYNGETGESLGTAGYSEPAPMFVADLEVQNLVGVVRILICSQVGDRVAGVIPAEEALGAEGRPEYGLGPGDSLIFVADILEIVAPPDPLLEQLVGDQKPTPEGFPEVSIDGTTVDYTLPEGEVPTTYAVATLIDGEGTMVYDGAEVVVRYHGVNWNTGEVFDSNFDDPEPAGFLTSGVIPGFRDGLVGQNVGSRVLITIPPALGYGPAGGTQDGRIGAEDTIFFVVDILGIR
jgi:peptidylprolyl isomerase